jgi:hypothetical protein
MFDTGGVHNMRSASAFALAAILAASSAATAAPGGRSLAPRLLYAHNAERAAMGAAPLAWDSALAAAADAYARQLAATDRWGHSQPHQRRGQGENLWMGTRGYFSPEKMVGDWLSERRMFRPGIFPNVSRTGSWHDVGHYTQIVWAGTRRVGCSVRSSRRWDYLVCRYAAPGNVTGARVGPAAVASRATRAPRRPTRLQRAR